MSSPINTTKIALLLLFAAGYYATWHILLNNGTSDYMAHIRDVGPRLLPGTQDPLKTVYIRIAAIDHQLTVLALFFWELVDGSNPAASLFCFHFATQVACGWPLLMIEGLRRGHRCMIISFIGTLGILIQNATYAVIVPIYLIIYLSTSPLISSKQIPDYLLDTADIVAIPVSMYLGYAIPAVLMSLPAPSIVSFEQKQTFMAIWQMFPLWVAILQAVLPYVMSKFLEGKAKTAVQSHKTELGLLRGLYFLLLVIAGIGQASTFTLLATSKWFPNLFAPEFIGVFNLTNVFVPRAMSSATKMSSIGAGAHMLLQYDELVGSTSMALFASVLYISKVRNSKSHSVGLARMMIGIAAFVLTGPLGYAVACIWARDELVAADSLQDDKKTS